jgi:hypothetical protein
VTVVGHPDAHPLAWQPLHRDGDVQAATVANGVGNQFGEQQIG